MNKAVLLASTLLIFLTACKNKEQEYDATGTFEVTEVTVSAKASGELVSFIMQEGDTLTAQAVVGQIDNVQLTLKKAQLSASRNQIIASKRQLGASRGATDSKKLNLDQQVASLRQQIANAKREKQRYSELLRDGAVPRKQVDDISYQISVLEKQLAATQEQIRSNNASLKEQSAGIGAQMEGADAQLAGIDAQIAQLDDQIANTVIRTPISGTVLEKYVEQGEFVTVGKPLFKVSDTRNVFLRAYVTSAQLERIKVGQTVTVMTDYGNNSGKTYEGIVSWISSKSEFTPKTIVTEDERADLVYAVKVQVKNGDDIKMGMYGKLKF